MIVLDGGDAHYPSSVPHMVTNQERALAGPGSLYTLQQVYLNHLGGHSDLSGVIYEQL